MTLRRNRPFTASELARARCHRCPQPATTQWRTCALPNAWLGLCTRCDVELNRLALDFARVPRVDRLISRYRMRKVA